MNVKLIMDKEHFVAYLTENHTAKPWRQMYLVRSIWKGIWVTANNAENKCEHSSLDMWHSKDKWTDSGSFVG